MSLHPHPIDPVPEPTARVAHAAFPKGSLAIRIRDELGVIYQDEQFAPLFPTRGQSAVAPWRLMLVTLLQFAEDLTDRQAAEAVRGSIDWKDALSLPLDDPGFDFSVLSEFRTRLLAPGAGAGPAGHAAGPAQGARSAQGPRAAAHRFDACAGRHSRRQSAGAGGGDAAAGAEQPGGRRAGLAAGAAGGRLDGLGGTVSGPF